MLDPTLAQRDLSGSISRSKLGTLLQSESSPRIFKFRRGSSDPPVSRRKIAGILERSIRRTRTVFSFRTRKKLDIQSEFRRMRERGCTVSRWSFGFVGELFLGPRLAPTRPTFERIPAFDNKLLAWLVSGYGNRCNRGESRRNCADFTCGSSSRDLIVASEIVSEGSRATKKLFWAIFVQGNI